MLVPLPLCLTLPFLVEGGRVALVVGDASGKGLEAAARTAEVKFALRAYLRDDGPIALAQVMGRLNRFLCDFQRLDNRQGGDFVALALALVTPATGEVQVCLAGAEPPLIVREGGEAEEVSSKGRSFPGGNGAGYSRRRERFHRRFAPR